MSDYLNFIISECFSLRMSENKRKNENFLSVQKISLEEMSNVHDPDPVLDPDPFLQGESRTGFASKLNGS